METDDKAGSSPAGKAADVVIMIILIFKRLYFLNKKKLAPIMHVWGKLCMMGIILKTDEI